MRSERAQESSSGASASRVSLGRSRAAYQASDFQGALDHAIDAVASVERSGERATGAPPAPMMEALEAAANAKRALGRYDAAERDLRRALALATGEQDGALRLRLSCALAVLHKFQGRFDEADRLYGEVLRELDGAEPRDEHALATVFHNLAGLAHARHEWSEGERWARLALDARRRASLAVEGVDVAADLGTLAAILEGKGELDEADAHYRRALAIFERELGPDHYEVAVLGNNLGALSARRGELGEAAALYHRALDIQMERLGAEHPEVGVTLNNLAALEAERGQFELALSLYDRSLPVLVDALGEQHPFVEIARANRSDLAEGMRTGSIDLGGGASAAPRAVRGTLPPPNHSTGE